MTSSDPLIDLLVKENTRLKNLLFQASLQRDALIKHVNQFKTSSQAPIIEPTSLEFERILKIGRPPYLTRFEVSLGKGLSSKVVKMFMLNLFFFLSSAGKSARFVSRVLTRK
jgi:hypothetical protein